MASSIPAASAATAAPGAAAGDAGGAATAPPANFFDKKPLGNYHATVFAVCITLLGLCWITTSARLWTRFRITKSPGLDDLFVVFTLIVITMGTVAFCVATRFGLGDHIYLINLADLPNFLKCHYIVGASYTSSTAFVKISLLLQYLRVFKRGSITYRICQFMVIFISLWGFAYSFLSWLCCLPKPSAFWNLTDKGCYGFASPIKSHALATIESHAAVNMTMDLIVLIIPFRLLFIRDTPSKTKKGLMVLLFMGALINAFSVWRLQSIISSQAGFYPVLDPTWNEPESTLLSFVEVYLSAITASTPVFWPVLEKQLTKIFVMYEVNVTSEARHREDEVELAHSESWPSGGKSGSNEEVRSLESRSADGAEKGQNKSKETQAHYTDDFIQQQVNPFAEEFRGTTTVQSETVGKKKKGGFVSFQ